jgi:[acyl-carrier-protein] S-malonyltransferase
MTGQKPAGGGVAVLCPGHGGEHDGMRERVRRHRPELLALAEELLSADPYGELAAGTEYLQPAVFCATLAGWDATADGLEPVAFAGHSLGEIAAVVLAGAMSPEDGLRVVVVRGRACRRAAERNPGGMLILKAGRDRAAEVASDYGLGVANDNAPKQTVVSGPADAIDALERDAAGLKLRAKRLGTAVPFHSPAMADAAEELAEALAGVELSEPSAPVVCAATAEPFTDVGTQLAEALVRPVRWRESLLALERLGASALFEPGPGRVLTGLAGRVLPDTRAWSAEDRLQ